jgi:hypothetical protein
MMSGEGLLLKVRFSCVILWKLEAGSTRDVTALRVEVSIKKFKLFPNFASSRLLPKPSYFALRLLSVARTVIFT